MVKTKFLIASTHPSLLLPHSLHTPHLSNSPLLAAQAKAFRVHHEPSFTSHVSWSYWFCFQNGSWIFSTILLLWPPPHPGPNDQHPSNGQLQQHPNQSVSVLPLLSPQFILHTHSSQNDPFKNQVSLYPTPSHGLLFRGDNHHGLLISLLPLTSSLTISPSPTPSHRPLLFLIQNKHAPASGPLHLCLECTSTSFCTACSLTSFRSLCLSLFARSSQIFVLFCSIKWHPCQSLSMPANCFIFLHCVCIKHYLLFVVHLSPLESKLCGVRMWTGSKSEGRDTIHIQNKS